MIERDVLGPALVLSWYDVWLFGTECVSTKCIRPRGRHVLAGEGRLMAAFVQFMVQHTIIHHRTIRTTYVNKIRRVVMQRCPVSVLAHYSAVGVEGGCTREFKCNFSYICRVTRAQSWFICTTMYISLLQKAVTRLLLACSRSSLMALY